MEKQKTQRREYLAQLQDTFLKVRFWKRASMWIGIIVIIIIIVISIK